MIRQLQLFLLRTIGPCNSRRSFVSFEWYYFRNFRRKHAEHSGFLIARMRRHVLAAHWDVNDCWNISSSHQHFIARQTLWLALLSTGFCWCWQRIAFFTGTRIHDAPAILFVFSFPPIVLATLRSSALADEAALQQGVGSLPSFLFILF